MNPEHYISITSIFSTLAIAVLTIWISRRDSQSQSETESRRHRDEMERETKRHRESLEREDRLRSERREDQRHIEFTIECDIFDPVDETCLAEIRLCAENKGQTVQRFSRISVRVRGISRDSQLSRWPDQGDRALFPNKIAGQPNIIPPNVTYFTEPGIRQVFTYVTTVPSDQRFILIHSEFDYLGEEGKTHNFERVIAVPAPACETNSE